MNIFQLIDNGSKILKNKNILSSQIDSEILLSKTLNLTREKVLINLDKTVSKKHILEFNELIYRRSLNEPLAYIIGEKEFWSQKFLVNRATLVPRPETELLVESLVKKFKKKNIFFLDIGTGCGCILISLISELKNSSGIGIDISNEALKIAKINANKLQKKARLKFLNKSLEYLTNFKFDLIVSNPPYIRSNQIKNLQEDVKIYEPKIALDGGNDGLDVIRKVIYKAKEILKINGTLALEIGNEQTFKVSKILLKNKFKIELKINDFQHNTRCLISKLISN